MSRPSAWPAPSCGRCAPRSPRTSSTTRSRRSPATSTRIPEEARELLTEFAEFTRYAFRGQRPYVTLADELNYVEKYLRLERARFGDRLQVRLQVEPEVLPAVVPVLSLQPLVENAVRHGVEKRGFGRIEIVGRHIDADVELRVSDDGVGMDPERAATVLAGQRRRRRDRQRAGAAAVDLRARLRAGDRERARAGDHRDDDAAEVQGGGAGGMTDAVLVVDDERPALEDLGRLLETSPNVEEVVLAGGAAEALRLLAERQFDVVFMDVRMPDIDGLELGKALRRFADPPALVFVSAFEDGAVSRLRARPAAARLPDEAGLAQRGSSRRSSASHASAATATSRRTHVPDDARSSPSSTSAAAPPGCSTARPCCTSRPRATTCGSTPTAAASWSARRCPTSSSAGVSTASCGCTAATSRTCAARSRSARSSAAR